MTLLWFLLTLALAYGLGSIPFGLLLARAAGLGDIRRVGSGNIGATNVMRTGHKALGLATLLLDAGKGLGAVLLTQSFYGHDLAAIGGLFAVLGHIFPVWLRFKGGKGVATSIGVLLGVYWPLGAAVCFVWLFVFGASRFASLASILSFWCAPVLAYTLDYGHAAWLTLAMAVLVTFTHRGNLKRLLEGTERSFRKDVP